MHSENSENSEIRKFGNSEIIRIIFFNFPKNVGLPKAACGDHGRYSLGSMLSIIIAGIEDKDRLYTGLPLYHSSGQWFAMGASVHGGCTVILRKGFSATKFWTDCVKYEATISQYIGEIARFLLGNYHYSLHVFIKKFQKNFKKFLIK
jgi:acyl-CoA synthetase (AMP-forming)/AMP-acid ligase II